MNIYYYSIQMNNLLVKHENIIFYINEIYSARKLLVINPQTIADFTGGGTEKVNIFDTIRNSIVNNTKGVSDIVRQKRPNEIYKHIEALILDLNLLDHSYNDENSIIIDMNDFIDKHIDVYSEKSPKYVMDLIEVCTRIYVGITNIKERCKYIITYYESSNKSIPNNYSKLSIGTDQDMPVLSDFTYILESIENLYNFICQINKIDYKTNKLMINQISTGSWFTDLLGVEPVILCIESLLKAIGGFIRDLITGKISFEKFDYECKKIDIYLDLVKKAELNGISNPELGILKGLQPLIKNFDSDTTSIEINGEEILNLRSHEKVNVIERKSKRTELIEQIQQIDSKNNIK